MNEEDGALTSHSNNLPVGIRFRVACTINLRSDIGFIGSRIQNADEVTTSALLFYRSPSVYNPIHLFILKYPNPCMRARKKYSYHATLVYFIIKIVLKVFGAKEAAELFDRPVRNTTTCVSNVIGPMEETSFRSHPIAPSSYGHSHALLVHFISYAEKMIISMAVDPTVIPGPDKIYDELEKSMKAMKLCSGKEGYSKPHEPY